MTEPTATELKNCYSRTLTQRPEICGVGVSKADNADQYARLYS